MGIGLPRAAGLACVVALLGAAPANATDHFVDDTGTGSGACTDPATPCTFNTLSGVGANDTIFVGGGTYAGPLGPGGNISFKASNFHPPQTAGQAIIDGGATQPAITVGSSPSSALGTVQGFVLRSGQNAVFAQNNVTLIGNTFDTSAPPTGGADVVVPSTAATSVTPVIQGNTFVDSSPTDGQEAIFLDGPTNAAHVTGNTFTGFFIGALVGQGGPTISGNTFDQVHANGTSLGRAIGVSNGDGSTSVTMDGNTLKPPLTPGGVNNSIGILLTDQGANTISATLSHNRIFGYDVGVRAADTDLGVSLDGDVIADSATADIRTNDSGTLNATDGNVTAKNITLGGTNTHAILQDSQLTLDSSIVADSSPGPAIVTTGGMGTAGCTITFSRGPAGGSGSCGGGAFQTNAAPGFVNPLADDFHLTAGSAMLDAANPTVAFHTDFDGDTRNIDGNDDCAGAPDMGADEFKPLVPFCAPPDTTIDSGPSGTTTDNTPTFGFSSTKSPSTFQCSLDGATFAACSNPFTTAALSNGSHALQVRAVEKHGVLDDTPASRSFTVVPPPLPPTPPRVSSLKQTAAAWRLGSALPRLSARRTPPIGTTFTFRLDRAAKARLTFTQRVAGRRVGRRCAAPTRANRRRARCTRTVTAGILSFAAHAGANSVRFQGRLSRTRRLRPGLYKLVLTAAASGLTSAPRTLVFRIVAG